MVGTAQVALYLADGFSFDCYGTIVRFGEDSVEEMVIRFSGYHPAMSIIELMPVCMQR